MKRAYVTVSQNLPAFLTHTLHEKSSPKDYSSSELHHGAPVSTLRLLPRPANRNKPVPY